MKTFVLQLMSPSGRGDRTFRVKADSVDEVGESNLWLIFRRGTATYKKFMVGTSWSYLLEEVKDGQEDTAEAPV